MKVFIDGILTEISETELKNYNVIVNKSNGYSHDYLAIEKFDRNKHFRSQVCPFTNKLMNFIPTHLTTKEVTNHVVNSGLVTFS